MSIRGTTFKASDTLVVEVCCNCHMPFAVTDEFKDDRLKDKKTFYCPAGHPQSYVGKSDEQKIRDLENSLAKARDNAEFWKQQERRAIINAKAAATRAANRAKAGACPCCDRTFVQMARHIATKHPEFATES